MNKKNIETSLKKNKFLYKNNDYKVIKKLLFMNISMLEFFLKKIKK